MRNQAGLRSPVRGAALVVALLIYGTATACPVKWDPIVDRGVDFAAPPRGECVIRLVMQRPSQIVLRLDRTDKKEEWPAIYFRLERPGPHGPVAYEPMREARNQTFILYEPGEYHLAIKKADRSLLGEAPPGNEARYRIAALGLEPVARELSLLKADNKFAASISGANDVKRFPIRVAERSRVRFLVEPARPADSAPDRRIYTVEIKDAQGIKSDPVWADWTSETRDSMRQLTGFEVIVEPGPHTLVLDRQFSSSMDMEKARPISTAVSVVRISPEPVPAAAQPVVNWLEATGLSRYLRFVDLYIPKPGPARECPTSPFDVYERALYEAARIQAERRPKAVEGAQVTNPCDRSKATIVLQQPFVPRVHVVMQNRLERFDLNKMEEEFAEKAGATVWDRIFAKLGSSLQISPSQMSMHVPVWCDASTVFSVDGRARRYGSVCMSGGASSAVFGIPVVATTARATSVQAVARIGAPIVDFLKAYYAPRGGNLTFLEQGDNYVEAIVRGLKGEVLAGGSDWERLQVIVFLVSGGQAQATLRTTIDGRIASGLGGYPADSNFITDMEPRYGGALSEYARRLLNEIQKALQLGGAK